MLTPSQFATNTVQRHLTRSKLTNGFSKPVDTIERMLADAHGLIVHQYRVHGAEQKNATTATLREVYDALREMFSWGTGAWAEKQDKLGLIAAELIEAELVSINIYLGMLNGQTA